jgi:hypothetical protein
MAPAKRPFGRGQLISTTASSFMTSSLATPVTSAITPVNPNDAALDRVIQRIANIETLCNAVYREVLLLGNELSECKWKGEYLVDPLWDQPEHKDKSRNWKDWLKLRGFVLRQGERDIQIQEQQAYSFMAWASCTATLYKINEERSDPLPLPTNPSQLTPYQGLFERVEDWSAADEWSDDVIAKASPNALRDTGAPYAENQARFIATWEKVCQTIPIDKRTTSDGLLAPPSVNLSKQYFSREKAIRDAEAKAKKAAEEEAKNSGATTVGNKPQTFETRKKGATAKPPKKPSVSAEELARQAAEASLVKDIQDYRNALHNLRVSADALETILKNILVRGGDERLVLMRQRTDMGIFSVHDDMELLRGAVETCQAVFRLATEKYQRPEPISRHEVDPQTATVEV